MDELDRHIITLTEQIFKMKANIAEGEALLQHLLSIKQRRDNSSDLDQILRDLQNMAKGL